MYALLHDLRSPVATIREASTLAVAFIVAEVFYKFHSFSLECAAFLVTWTALSGLADLNGRLFKKHELATNEEQ
jgi:hypothetical protein